jgi:integrase
MGKRRSRGEGTIYFVKSKSLWAAQISLPDGRRKTKYAKSQSDVKQWLLEKRKALIDGFIADDKNMTIGQFIDRWFDEVASHNLKPSTLISHNSIIKNHIKPELGEIRLGKLKPSHLQTLYSNKLSSGLSKRTVLYIHTIVHQTLNLAIKQGLIARNVADAVNSPRPVRKKVEPLTKGEVAQLLEVLKGDRLFALYVVYLGLGLRRGEALALTKDCLDMEKRIIHIRKSLQSIIGKGLVITEPKSESSFRSLALPNFVYEALKTHLDNQIVESEYIFCTSKGTPFGPRNVARHFKKTLKKAGLPDHVRLHDLRHTFVSYMLSRNVPPKDVSEIAGHSTFAVTTDIYGHLMPGAKREAAEKMNTLFEN